MADVVGGDGGEGFAEGGQQRVACACRVCVSRVRAAIRRRAVLSFENIRSIGFNSGLYGGRNSSRTPAAAHRFRARGAAPS